LSAGAGSGPLPRKARTLATLGEDAPNLNEHHVVSGYAAQVSLLAAAKRSPLRLPRAMRSQPTFLAHGLQILSGEVPGDSRGDLTKDLREVTHLLVACRRDADELNRRVV
jgi:hypothetical protein